MEKRESPEYGGPPIIPLHGDITQGKERMQPAFVPSNRPPPDSRLYYLPETEDNIEEAPVEAFVDIDEETNVPESDDSIMGTFSAYHDRSAKLATDRNKARIEEANDKDRSIIGKYLPSSIDSFFHGCWIEGMDDFFVPSPDWLESVRKVCETEEKVPTAPPFRFGLDGESLKHNAKILSSFDFDFAKCLESCRGSTVWHGSEFRPVDRLGTFLSKHPCFPFLASLFTHGMPFHLSEELTEEERMRELRGQLARGNHPSALEDTEKVSKLLTKEVTHGFSLPIPKEKVPTIRRAMVQPCGLVSQFSLQADGSRELKQRLTHDLSYSMTKPNASINSRVEMDRYPEMVYGWCLIRIIHFIVSLRCDFPTDRILISKFDYSDAYRRVSHSASAAAQSILTLGETGFISLRLTFGGSPNPPTFCAFSETLTDVANELSLTSFDPKEFSSPTVQASHTRTKIVYGDDIPLAKGIRPAVRVPTSLNSRKDCFIDDIISVFLDRPDVILRECHIVPLAVHVLSRPHAGDDLEPLRRRALLAKPKLEAEGRPCEVQVVLGWEIDSRRLELRLPFDKFTAWSQDLEETIAKGGATTKALESLIGRLNHASYVIPLSRHFLNDLRDRISAKGRRSKQTLRLSSDEINDLILWKSFLKKARSGLSLNLLTIRSPTHLAWSDSCPYGLGGYTLRGVAWRIKIKQDSPIYGEDAANNVLEFLGNAISLLLLMREAKSCDFPCLLALGDNTSGIGWIFKTGRIGRSSIYYRPAKFIARRIATEAIENDAQICAQHIKGCHNDVSDILSFEGDQRGAPNEFTYDRPDDITLSQRFHDHLPQLIPENFLILPLPPEINSFALQALQMISESLERSRKSRGRRPNELGKSGKALSQTSVSEIPSYTGSAEMQGNSSVAASQRKSDPKERTTRTDLIQSIRSRWLRRLSGIPSAMWVRRFGQSAGQAPCTSATGVPVPTTPLHQSSATY